MLDPSDRKLLFESLRPPTGYSLDRAVGTTYSLDLMTLLTAPLAFTLFDWEDKDGGPVMEPLALLEALRQHAENVVVFCQAGRINVPPREQRLLGYLEDSVFEVSAPIQGGVFHPKVCGVLPDWTAHRGDVRCGGRPHGESSTEGGRTAGV